MIIEVLMYVLAIAAALTVIYGIVSTIFTLIDHLAAKHRNKAALKERIEYYKRLSRDSRNIK